MGRMFFMGAGASAAAGYPLTKWLTYPVAHYLWRYRQEKKDRPSRLEEYLATTYSLDASALAEPAKLWDAFVNSSHDGTRPPLPDPEFMPASSRF
jgi:hypothetical protein